MKVYPNCRDESDRDGIRVVLELKRGEMAEVVLNNLYKHTQMETTFGIIMLALVNGQPRILTLKKLLGHFLQHRRDVVLRRTRFELRKAEERAHILEGLKIALDHLDEIICPHQKIENTRGGEYRPDDGIILYLKYRLRPSST